jgi:hypothetical protein
VQEEEAQALGTELQEEVQEEEEVTGTPSNRRVRRVAAAAGIGAGASLAMSGVASAATYVVGTADDSSSVGDCAMDNTDCSLRQAITLANGNTGGDTVAFHTGLTGTLTLGSDLPTVTDPVYIYGSEAPNFTIDGAGTHRIFDLDPDTPGDPVTMLDLTLAHGNSASSTVNSQSGGAILNETADLTLGSSVVTGSTARVYGGGIYSGCDGACGNASGDGDNASLKIDDSTISGNSVPSPDGWGGGGVYFNYGSGRLAHSTVSGNHADDVGGGMSIWRMESMLIDNSTIAGNGTYNPTENGLGGGIYLGQVTSGLTVDHSTIAGNSARTGGGIYDMSLVGDTSLSPELINTIVGGNSAATASPDLFNAHGSSFDSVFSLITSTSGATVNETVIGSDVTGVNPGLGALAANGGPTQTMAPQCDSPAIDKGDSFLFGWDQRYLSRLVQLSDYPDSTAPGADGADIGAVELQTSPGTNCTPPPSGGGSTPPTATPTPTPKKKCKKKHKRSASIAKKCKKKRK